MFFALNLCNHTAEFFAVAKLLAKALDGFSIQYSTFIIQVCLQLSRRVVQNIHLGGGSILGVARGGPSVKEIVDSMQV